jgi:hypothetical protein
MPAGAGMGGGVVAGRVGAKAERTAAGAGSGTDGICAKAAAARDKPSTPPTLMIIQLIFITIREGGSARC